MDTTLPDGSRSVSYWLRLARNTVAATCGIASYALIVATSMKADDLDIPLSISTHLAILAALVLVQVVAEGLLRHFQDKEFGVFLYQHMLHNSDPDPYAISDVLSVTGASSRLTRIARRLVDQLTLNRLSTQDFNSGMRELAGTLPAQ